MIRLSQSVPGGFTVSFLVDAQGNVEMRNKRLIYNPQTQAFQEKDKNYQTLEAFIEDHKDKIGLKAGVECDTFSYLFRTIKSQNSKIYDE